MTKRNKIIICIALLVAVAIILVLCTKKDKGEKKKTATQGEAEMEVVERKVLAYIEKDTDNQAVIWSSVNVQGGIEIEIKENSKIKELGEDEGWKISSDNPEYIAAKGVTEENEGIKRFVVYYDVLQNVEETAETVAEETTQAETTQTETTSSETTSQIETTTEVETTTEAPDVIVNIVLESQTLGKSYTIKAKFKGGVIQSIEESGFQEIKTDYKSQTEYEKVFQYIGDKKIPDTWKLLGSYKNDTCVDDVTIKEIAIYVPFITEDTNCGILIGKKEHGYTQDIFKNIIIEGLGESYNEATDLVTMDINGTNVSAIKDIELELNDAGEEVEVNYWDMIFEDDMAIYCLQCQVETSEEGLDLVKEFIEIG